MITISPSILAADFARLGEECRAVEAAGADMLHLDVMDGHLVPNITFGMPVIAALKKVCGLFFDVHIMISEPQKYIRPLADAGADQVTFHIEAEGDPTDTIAMIHDYGMKAGISLKTATPVGRVLPFVPLLDNLLVMTVEPGFGGQAFNPAMCEKVKAACAERARLGRQDLTLQVDGGISRKTIAAAAASGADSFVAGSAVFRSGNYAAEIAELRALAQEAHPSEGEE